MYTPNPIATSPAMSQWRICHQIGALTPSFVRVNQPTQRYRFTNYNFPTASNNSTATPRTSSVLPTLSYVAAFVLSEPLSPQATECFDLILFILHPTSLFIHVHVSILRKFFLWPGECRPHRSSVITSQTTRLPPSARPLCPTTSLLTPSASLSRLSLFHSHLSDHATTHT